MMKKKKVVLKLLLFAVAFIAMVMLVSAYAISASAATQYTVTFNANGGTGGPTTQTKYEDVELTLTTSKPSRTGYTFLGWHTKPDVFEEVEYYSGDTYSRNESDTLYAVWRENPVQLSQNSTNSATISKGGHMKYFYYKPATSGTYVIYSTGSADTVLELYGSDFTHYETVDLGDNLDNFRAVYDLEANVKYIFGIRYWSENTTGTISFNFGRMYTVSYSTVRGDLYETQKSVFWSEPIGDLPELYEEGYNFLGWSFTGTNSSSYVSTSDTYTYTQNKTLYANWERITYTVTYNANGGTGAPDDQIKYHGTNLRLTSQKPTRTGYTFLGWSTDPNALEEVEYPSSSTYEQDKDLALYAVWRKNPTVMGCNNTYSTTVSRGGEIKYFSYTPATSDTYVIYSTGADDTFVYLYDANYTELDKDDQGGLNNNFRLERYLTEGTTYIFGVCYYSYDKMGTIQFAFGKVYTISYDANGGTGAPDSQRKDYNAELILSDEAPSRTGHTFLGWGTSSSSTAASYQPGGTYTSNSDKTLYAVWKANEYTITFDANGGTGGPTKQTKTHGVNLTLPTSKPTRSGYTFLGWATSSSATAATYQPGGTYTGNADDTLYAVWKPNEYMVTLHANGGAFSGGGTIIIKYHDIPLIFPTDNPTRAGYSFLGWATRSSATTATYQPGSTYTANASIDLYAVWKANAYTITFNANGGTGGPTSQIKTHGVNLTLPTSKPTRSGYTFLGWATSSSATTVTYQAGDTYADNANETLYAVWEAGREYIITFDANGGTDAPASQTKIHGIDLTLSKIKPKRTGYIFEGWATISTTTVASYQPGETYRKEANATLYAVWKPIEYTVTYNAHGGTGAPAAQTKYYNGDLTLTNSEPTYTGYTFKGWATRSGGAVVYQAGGTYRGNADITLYAVWEKQAHVHIDADANGLCDECNLNLSTIQSGGDEEGLSGGAIVGIVAVSVIGAGGIGVAVYWFVIRKKRR